MLKNLNSINERYNRKRKEERVFINANGISCIPYRCKRQSYHKETKTTKENNIVTTNVIEDRRNLKFGGGMFHPMKMGYSKMIIKPEALKYAIMAGDKIELPLRNANKD